MFHPGVPFMSNWHIDTICDHLQAVSEGQIKNLLITMPPRSGKSSVVSVAWPTWEWAKRPGTQFLFTSYSHDLTRRDSLRCKRILEGDWYRERWPYMHIMDDQNQTMRFENQDGGVRMGISVCGSTTGEGGDIIVVDDAHNVKEGESEAMRESVTDWWDNVLSTRLNDARTGRFVVIMQRIHEADLAGHILSRERAAWDHLNLPMEFERKHSFPIKSTLGFKDVRKKEGELLWPARVGMKEVATLKLKLGSYGTAGQLQQRPSPAGGGKFKRNWFRYWSNEREGLIRCGDILIPLSNCVRFLVADMALSTKEGSSWTCVAEWLITPKNQLVLLDLWRDRVEAPDAKKLIKNWYVTKKPQYIAIEDKHYGSAYIQEFLQDGLPIRKLVADVDKITRATTAAVRLEGGTVFFPERASWLEAFEEELLHFPAGQNDDQVDVLSYAALQVGGGTGEWEQPNRIEGAGSFTPGFNRIMEAAA